VWQTHLFLVYGHPVGRLEPLLALNVGHAVLHVAQPLGQIGLQQTAHQILDFRAEHFRILDLSKNARNEWILIYKIVTHNQFEFVYLSRHDFLVELNGLVGHERRLSRHHFKDQNAKGPPVDSFVVTL
jgi:hypothetical protein